MGKNLNNKKTDKKNTEKLKNKKAVKTHIFDGFQENGTNLASGVYQNL